MTEDEIYSKLTEIFRDVFDDDEITVNEQTTADDIDDWDSLAQISLIAAVEGEFGIRFDMKTALNLKNAGDIARQISALLN
ncbi:MAG: acyl carrier protein [Flexilinea sp.]|nr:acyl carrier protein [Flexilinea sp.]